ncbi:MAG TPA: hypothetical protein VIW64_04310 [Pyrinomonadaceae bacterium]|jgi:hypothetical protein
MPDTTPVQVNFINPAIFYQSHSATFVDANASQSHAIWIRGGSPDIARVSLTSLYILISNLEQGYKILKPLLAKVEPVGDGYVASFDEANIHASGETWSRAALNLKSLVLDIYDSLISETSTLSGPAKNQLATLLRYVEKDNS